MAMVFCRGCGKEIHETARVCPACGFEQVASSSNASIKSQNVTVLLATFLGGLGIHRFYLGKTVSGIVYLLFCWTGIPGLIAYVEALVYTFQKPETWARTRNDGRLTTPVHPALKVLALIFPALFILGILAALFIPSRDNIRTRGNDREQTVKVEHALPATTLASLLSPPVRACL